MAPKDDHRHIFSDFRNCCWITEECGLGLTPYGYYHCAIAGGIDSNTCFVQLHPLLLLSSVQASETHSCVTVRRWLSFIAPEPSKPFDTCSSTDLLSQPRAISSFYGCFVKTIPRFDSGTHLDIEVLGNENFAPEFRALALIRWSLRAGGSSGLPRPRRPAAAIHRRAGCGHSPRAIKQPGGLRAPGSLRLELDS